MHFSNHLDTANGPPLPPPNIVGINKHFYGRVKCTGVHKLGGEGKGGKFRQIVLIVLRILASIVGLVNRNSNGRFEG